MRLRVASRAPRSYPALCQFASHVARHVCAAPGGVFHFVAARAAGYRIQAHASHAQHCCQGCAPRRTDHQSCVPRSRPHRDPQEAAERLRHRSGQGRRRGDHRDAEDRLPRPRDPRGRIGRIGERIRVQVDHRSARRHHQLHPRLPVLLRVDRARAQGRRHAGRRLRSEPQRPVHGHPRPRRVPERPPHSRRPTRWSARASRSARRTASTRMRACSPR